MLCGAFGAGVITNDGQLVLGVAVRRKFTYEAWIKNNLLTKHLSRSPKEEQEAMGRENLLKA